jgi:hypothetical protein
LKKFLFLVAAAILIGGLGCQAQFGKGKHPRTISAQCDLIQFCGFREDLNVKVHNVRWTPSDRKSSHGLWPGKLMMKNGKQRHDQTTF